MQKRRHMRQGIDTDSDEQHASGGSIEDRCSGAEKSTTHAGETKRQDARRGPGARGRSREGGD